MIFRKSIELDSEGEEVNNQLWKRKEIQDNKQLMSHTKIENFGIETRAGNCGSLLCSSDNNPDQD
jgi:hypothetical protein